MALWGWLGGNAKKTADGLPQIFPLLVTQAEFVRIDVKTMYEKILTDVVERTHGIDEKYEKTLWDSCLKSDNAEGLISMISEAMSEQKDLFLVYDKTHNIVRKAKPTEAQKIKEEYAREAKSSVGVYISFTKFEKAKLVKMYSQLSYCVAGALNTGMNISMALQIAIKELRAGVGFSDSPIAIAQAKTIADALNSGTPVLIDAEDQIRNALPDLTSVEKAMTWINKKLSFYLNLPASYVDGEQTGGMNATGESDTKAIERGLKSYFKSIIEPILGALFDAKVSYKSQDFRQIAQALEAAKTFDLISHDYLGPVSKRKIIQGLLDLDDEDVKADLAEIKELEKKLAKEAVNNPPPKDVTPQGNNQLPPSQGKE